MLSTNIMLTKQAYTIHLYTKNPRCQNSNDNGPVQLLLSQNKRPKIEKTPSQISLTPKIPQKLSPIHQQDIFISDYTIFSLTSVFPDFPAAKQIPKWVSIKDINSFKYKYNRTYYTHTKYIYKNRGKRVYLRFFLQAFFLPPVARLLCIESLEIPDVTNKTVGIP